MLLGALENRPGAPRDIVCLNAGVALYTANVVPTIQQGVVLADQTLASGAARAKLEAYVQATQELGALSFPLVSSA